MRAMLLWLVSPESAQIVQALLHSLWLGGSLALLLGLALRQVASPFWRYRLALGSLGGVALGTVLAWAVLNQPAVGGDDLRSPDIAQTASAIQTDSLSGELPPLVITVAGTRPTTPATAAPVNWMGSLALFWAFGALLMLARAVIQVAGAERLRSAGQPLQDARIAQLLAEAQRAIRLTRKIRVTVAETLTSPAVVGVMLPTLILPLSLVTTLTHEQLRFVLLHELAHIRRGDYFANLFQLFVEALLFFNPAVWWISQQVRREREACCDALAIELSGAPVAYARTLVQVAESALSPSPAAAAAFGNKQREPSSLSDRVQRLLVPGYRPSLRFTWRATLMSLVAGGILLILSALGTRTTVGAILAHEKSLDQQADAAKTDSTAQTASTNAVTETRTNAFSDLVRPIVSSDKRSGGPRIAWISFHADSTTMTNAGSGPATLSSVPWASYFGGLGRELIIGDTRAAGVAQRLRSLNTELELSQLRRIFLRDPFTDEDPQVKHIDQEIARLETEKALLESEDLITSSFNYSVNEPANAATEPTTPLVTTDIHTLATQVPVLDDLPLIGKLFRSDSNDVSNTVTNSDQLLTRRFKVNLDRLYQALEITSSNSSNQNATGLAPISQGYAKDGISYLTRTNTMQLAHQAIRRLFADAGVDLQSPKAVFLNDRIGELFVRASLADLDQIQEIIDVVNTAPAQVSLKVFWVEFSPTNASGIDWYLGNFLMHYGGTNMLRNPSSRLGGILTDPQFRVVLRALEQRNGEDVVIVTIPEVQTVSGRLTRILLDGRSGDPGTNGASPPPDLPTLDLIPYVSADGTNIQMTLISPAPGELMESERDSTYDYLPPPFTFPRGRHYIHSVTTKAAVSSGQTIFLDELPLQHREKSKPGQAKHRLIFVTARVVDPAGNPLHSDEALESKQKATEPQRPAGHQN